MATLPDESVNLIVTSPPFPLTFQKKNPYESISADRYVGWFIAYAEQFK
jgi:site-specific DNA-methyltransferase (cytosine-N4-specific)